jgi:osmotically-inducible protein OsmY
MTGKMTGKIMVTFLRHSLHPGAIAACILLVSLSGCNKTKDMTGNPPSVAIDTAVDDSVITAKVKAALLTSGDLKSLDLQVKTRNHEVTLSGFAVNKAQIETSIVVAKGVDRVTSVVNHINIKK